MRVLAVHMHQRDRVEGRVPRLSYKSSWLRVHNLPRWPTYGASHAARLSAMGTSLRAAVLARDAPTVICPSARSMSPHSSRSISADLNPANPPMARQGGMPVDDQG